MNKLNLAGIDDSKIKVDVNDSATGIVLEFKGEIDMEDPGALLDPFFDEVHNGVIKNEIKEVVADFTALTFLNSSGIKAIVKWIMKLAAMLEDQRYRFIIKHDKSITWQVTSLPTLSYLVPGAVEIE